MQRNFRQVMVRGLNGFQPQENQSKFTATGFPVAPTTKMSSFGQ
jgi:hypothetical protein